MAFTAHPQILPLGQRYGKYNIANGLTYKLPAAGVPCDMWISGTAGGMFVVTARHAAYPHITRLNNDKPFYFNLIQASPIIESFLVLLFKKELLSCLRLIAV